MIRVSIDLDSLALRPIRLSDTDRIHEWASSPEACRFQTWGPNTAKETLVYVTSAVDAWKARPQQRWVWSVVDGDDVVLGVGELKRHNETRAEISYIVHVDYWGQGVATAIGRLLTQWAFEADPAVERVEATCDPRNVGSEKVLRRVGMTYEGTMRHMLLIRDGWRDSKLFSILRHEWS